jgi:hypothetical protein
MTATPGDWAFRLSPARWWLRIARRYGFAALVGIAPKDELESMMAAQLIAAHNAAME